MAAFDTKSVAKAVEMIVAQGHKQALVGTVNKDGAEVVFGIKLNNSGSWELQGSFDHKWSGDNDGSVKILWSK